MDWLRVLAKRRAAPRFSVNRRCSKQLFLLRRTQPFLFVELQLFLFVELVKHCSYLSNFKCSCSLNFNCNFLWTRGVLINCSYYVELQLFSFCRTSSALVCQTSTVLIRQTSTVLVRRTSTGLIAANFNCSYYVELTSHLRCCILYQESTLLCQLWTLHYSADLKYHCSYWSCDYACLIFLKRGVRMFVCSVFIVI